MWRSIWSSLRRTSAIYRQTGSSRPHLFRIFCTTWNSTVRRRILNPRKRSLLSKLWSSTTPEEVRMQGKSFGYKAAAIMMVVASVAVLMIPVYRIYCAHWAGGSMAFRTEKENIPLKDKLPPLSERRELVTVQFTCSAHPSMPVRFVPCQSEMTVLVGEPALAFFACYNTTNETLHGMATYTIYPPSAHFYFNKLQCFCFEEQRIKPHEYIELPVFFYIDSDFSLDPNTGNADFMILSYTFFSVDAKP